MKPDELASKLQLVAGTGDPAEALDALAEFLVNTYVRMQEDGRLAPRARQVVAPDPAPLPQQAAADREPEALWTIKRVATYCSVSPRTVTRWRKRGDLAAAGRRPPHCRWTI